MTPWFNKLHVCFLTNTLVGSATPRREGFAPCPLQGRTVTSPKATTGGERDALILRLTRTILGAE